MKTKAPAPRHHTESLALGRDDALQALAPGWLWLQIPLKLCVLTTFAAKKYIFRQAFQPTQDAQKPSDMLILMS